MYCTNMDLVESSSRSFIKVGNVKFGSFVTWRQFCQLFSLITFPYFGLTLPNEGSDELPKDGFD